MRDERPLSHVSAPVLALLAAGLALQIGLHAVTPEPQAKAQDLTQPPAASLLRLASLGDPIALAKILMLQLQAFDYQSGSKIPYKELDYARVEAWLSRILELDPGGQYPLLAASRLYAEVPDEARQRSMLDFVYRQYLLDPNRRWPWLAHATFLAKHRLQDMDLALKYAAALQKYTTAKDVPAWATTMEIFIREDMNELETARVMIGGLLASGRITDRGELNFLDGRLREIEERLKQGAPRNAKVDCQNIDICDGILTKPGAIRPQKCEICHFRPGTDIADKAEPLTFPWGNNMKTKQTGFTLVEIAIVLVIIGLLLGGILKGQEMITQAKIKNVVNDFNGITAAMNSYQDRYRALPGDDLNAAGRWGTNAGRLG